MIPRLLDIEFLPLKPSLDSWRQAEIFRPRDGNFPSLVWKFSAHLQVMVYFVLKSVLMTYVSASELTQDLHLYMILSSTNKKIE